MTTAQPPDELPVWAEKIHRTGRNISHALKPWRDLPWPRKTTITATAVAAGAWLLDLHQAIPWPW